MKGGDIMNDNLVRLTNLLRRRDNLKVKIEVFIESSDIEAIEKLAKTEGEYRNNKVLEESNV
jgi:hypothetical protein